MAPDRIPVNCKSLIGLALFVLISLQTATAAPRDSDWEISKQGTEPGRGYELYQREVAGSGYDRYRIEAVVVEPIERVIRAVQARRSYDQYLAKGLTRTFLRRDSDDAVTYIRMKMPMIKDRDVALRSKRGFDEEHGIYRDEWWTANEEAPSLPDGVVRMTKSEGFWEITPAGENRTNVVYESHADPGGRVPSWIANSSLGGQVIGQIETLHRILDDYRSDVASPPIVSDESRN